jgi:hypothetical protein
LLGKIKHPIRYGKRRYDYTKRMRISDGDHAVWIRLFWKQRSDTKASKALVSNRRFWGIVRILLVHRYCWTRTETFHRDGKQQYALKTIGKACWAVKSELLEQPVDGMVAKVGDDQWSIPQIKVVLVHT